MPTKLSRYAEGVMEAAWLAALVVPPVFFNIYSSRIFEPDKIALLRSLALLILLAWIVKLLDQARLGLEPDRSGQPRFVRLLRTPLVAPVVALAMVYLVSTVFSITPRISLFGSYQRLQGTYTTLSYLVVFAAIAANLRRREQVERIVTLVILASLPVSLYGVLQRFQLDPIPWGDDVTRRIAANMGNSIFVAAYLVMVFPLTVGRIVRSYEGILKEKDQSRLILNLALGTLYVFIASLQLAAQYLSGSRGPALALLISSFFLFLLLAVRWRKRILLFGVVGVGLALGTFLLLFNLAGGPFESLRNSPAIGRYGQLLDADSRNARVRTYIWQGAARLVTPHNPLEFPDGSRDAFNFLRPLIGYGPESMYVAFNPFYPPELGHLEGHNASPDRSHNETWDSLVITGVLGLAAYLALFGSVFYHGLKWIGLIEGRRQRRTFVVLLLAGGLLGTVSLVLWRGIGYFGVGLPFGVILGLIAYLVLTALFSPYNAPATPAESTRLLALAVLLAGIIAHFVEINFGIAIAATRTNFWVYAALILVVGEYLPRAGGEALGIGSRSAGPQDRPGPDTKPIPSTSGRKRRHGHPAFSAGRSGLGWVREACIAAGMVSLLMVSIGFNYISNPGRLDSPWGILWSSLVGPPAQGQPASPGILILVSIALASAALILVGERHQEKQALPFGAALAAVLAGSALVAWLYGLRHAASLLALIRMSPETAHDLLVRADTVGALMLQFSLVLLGLILLTGLGLVRGWPDRSIGMAGRGAIAAVVLGVLVFVLVDRTNLRGIRADIAFKMAEPYAETGQWPVATLLYKKAVQLAPAEDHYHFFLGLSYLEQARAAGDEAAQALLVRDAESTLLLAQSINPLSTDHTANLARLYSWWAYQARQPARRIERGGASSYYFSRALALSPNNVVLWGEWAILFWEILDLPDQALLRLEHALELDPENILILGLSGDYYHQLALTTTDSAARTELFEKAVSHYKASVDLSKGGEALVRVANLISLGEVYTELDKPELAVAAYQAAIQAMPIPSEVWKIQEAIAYLYAQMGDRAAALEHANLASQSAPPDQIDRLQALMEQLRSMP